MSIGTQPFKTSFVGADPGEAARPKGRGFVGGKVTAFARRYPAFMIVVVIPIVLSVIFYGFIESNVYVSTAQFVVQEANQNTSLTSLGSFLQSTGITTTSNDAYTVNTYLMSRDAVAQLEKKVDLRAIYSRPGADFLDRFPNFIYGPSFESLFNHYLDWTKVNFDTSANVTTLTVQAFRPADAHAVAEQLLALSENEVNRLNDRLREDALRAARREVATLQGRMVDVSNEITAFRKQQLMLDPNETSTQSVSLLSSLESQLVAARAALSQQTSAAANSPGLPALRTRVSALEAQVGAESAKGAGGDKSLAPKISAYQQLLLRQQFLQQMLQAAVTSLESAEATVQQQQLYLARVAEPNMPDLPFYPFRHLIEIMIVVISVLLIYWIGRLIHGAVSGHVG